MDIPPELLARMMDPRWVAYASGRAVPSAVAASEALRGMPPEARLGAELFPPTGIPLAMLDTFAAASQNDIPGAAESGIGVFRRGALRFINEAADALNYWQERAGDGR